MSTYDNLKLAELNYNSYLCVDELLTLQKPIAKPAHHDEMFFIIIHQAAELWFKELLHETSLLVSALGNHSVSRALKTLKRINAIMELQVQQIRLLSTLTPVEFAGFREHLRPASGFQSTQFRKLEYHYGIRETFFLRFFEKQPQVVEEFQAILKSPSVYDHVIQALSHAGFNVPNELLTRDYTQEHQSTPALTEVLREIYEKPEENYHWVLFFESLLDFDQAFILWRNSHILMVARAIGGQSGTGGSAGYKFLESRLNRRCFPEIWELRNLIGKGAYEGCPHAAKQ